MNVIALYNRFFERYFPSPLSIALLLSVFTAVMAIIFTLPSIPFAEKSVQIMHFWFEGIFKASLLEFTLHMMLILVLGHVIALSKPAAKLIEFLLKYCTNSAKSAFFLSLFTMLLAWFNWGFALVFGAIFARKIAEKFQSKQQILNYPLLGVAAYIGMMVWHGGISGSAPLTVASATHNFVNEMGVIPMSKTIFSNLNIVTNFILLLILPISFYVVGKYSKAERVPTLKLNVQAENLNISNLPAERFERSPFLIILGFIVIFYFLFVAYEVIKQGGSFYNVLTLQTTNLLLLGLAFFSQGSVVNFSKALEEAIGDVSGIIIQFPLYFGIMGMIKGSGLALILATFFLKISSAYTLPYFTFLGAAVLNIFIPSGGGQWQVQAPIIITSAKECGVGMPKMIMSMAYGDQLTNLLQPFWALPLLSITQLKAKEILPYCVLFFAIGFVIFSFALLILQ